MDRKTMRLGILVPALIVALALSAAPAAVLACDDAQTQVITVIATDDAPPTPPPARPARPARAPRSPHGSATPAPVAAPAEVPETPEAPAPPDAPEAPDVALETPAPPAMITPRGYFGFGFQVDSYASRPAKGDSAAVWRFYTRPWVYSVDKGSPAARGGLQRGDIITGIDGISILNPAAGRRFGSIKPGQTVRWTVIRDGERRTMVVTAGERPGRAAIVDLQRELKRIRESTDTQQMRQELDELTLQIERRKVLEEVRVQTDRQRPSAQRLRYAGVIGDSEVEVRGSEAVIVNVDEGENEMVINIGNSVVKIRTADMAPKPKAKTPKK